MPRDGLWAEPLFNLISLRTGLKSTIIYIWLDFDKWNQNFVDKVIAATIVDMNRPSFRIKATKEWIDERKKKRNSGNNYLCRWNFKCSFYVAIVSKITCQTPILNASENNPLEHQL